MRYFALLLFCTLLSTRVDAQLPALWVPLFHIDTAGYYTWSGDVKKKTRNGEWTGVNTRFKDTIRAQYSNGKLNGAWTVHYADGKLCETGWYTNNLREGHWIKFNSRGDTLFYCTYKAGVLHGPYRTYTSHSKPTRAGYFTNGKKEGTWIASEYTNEGKLSAQTFYPFVHDTLEGTGQRRACDGVNLVYFLKGDILAEEYKSKPDPAYTCLEPLVDPVEELPSFPGGDAAFHKYLADSLRYPKRCIDEGIEGRVFVGFTVEADGSITNVTLRRGAAGAPEMDAEALRLIRAMPRWQPGKMNGKVTRVNMTVPVKFALNH